MKPHRDWQSAIRPCELVPEVIIGSKLDRLLWSDQQDVHPAPSVHAKVTLCSVSFPEAIRHAGVHLGAISGHLLVLKPGLDKVEGEDAGDADDAGNAAVDDLGQERELLLVDLLGGHDGPLLPDGRHG